MAATDPYPTVSSAAAAITIGDVLGVCWRHRWPALLAALATACVVVYVGLSKVPLYEAHAVLKLEAGSKATVFHIERETDSNEALLGAERDLLLATPTLRAALTAPALAADPWYRDHDDAIDRLRLRLRATTSHDSPTIELWLRDERGGVAEDGLRALIDAFKAARREQQGQRTREDMEALTRQVADAAKRLEEVRRAEDAFRHDKAIIASRREDNPATARLRALYPRRAELDRTLPLGAGLEQRIQAADALADPDQRLDALVHIEAIGAAPAVAAARSALGELRDRQSTLGQKYLEKHPRMIEVAQAIARKREELLDAVASARQLAVAVRAQQLAESAEVDRAIARDEAELRTFEDNVRELERMHQNAVSQETVFNEVQLRYNQELATSTKPSASIIEQEPPKALGFPINISRTITAAVAVALGALAAVTTAFVLNACDRRIRGSAGAREAGHLPVIASIPQVAALKPLARGGSHEQHPDHAEAYRGLRTTLKMTLQGEGCQVLLLTSACSGEGKSTVSAHLAISLAATGAKVLLVDGDMRKPSLHTMLGESCPRGLSSLLAGDALGAGPVPTTYPNLDLQAVGIQPHNPAELLHSQRLAAQVEQWRRIYHYVVIDSPPLDPVSDALLLGERADGVLMVARDRLTEKAMLAACVAKLAPLGKRVLGLVLNGDREQANRYGYPYFYSVANQNTANKASALSARHAPPGPGPAGTKPLPSHDPRPAAATAMDSSEPLIDLMPLGPLPNRAGLHRDSYATRAPEVALADPSEPRPQRSPSASSDG